MTPIVQSIQAACAALRAGEPVILPTDTVYGMGVAVKYCESPQVLYDLKQRTQKKPVAWLVGSLDDLLLYGREVPESVQMLARTFWPGPLTLVVKASTEVPAAYISSEGTIGLRMPDSPTVLEAISTVESPLAVTSANLAGTQAPKSFDAVDEELIKAVPAALKDKTEKSGLSSTVLDCTTDHPIVLREGAITIADILALS